MTQALVRFREGLKPALRVVYRVLSLGIRYEHARARSVCSVLLGIEAQLGMLDIARYALCSTCKSTVNDQNDMSVTERTQSCLSEL
jgi:hypothetical protein